jgi:hypothetical protein
MLKQPALIYDFVFALRRFACFDPFFLVTKYVLDKFFNVALGKWTSLIFTLTKTTIILNGALLCKLTVSLGEVLLADTTKKPSRYLF